MRITEIRVIFIVSGIVLMQLVQGYSDIQSRFKRSVDGSTTSIEEHPYMASLRIAGGHICGGTILSKNFILTIASCIGDDDLLDALYVKVGSADLNYIGSWHLVAKVIKHEKFNQSTSYEKSYGIAHSNVALLKLENPIAIDNITTSAVKLFNKGEKVQDYDKGEVVGWGFTPMIVANPDKTDDKSKIANRQIMRYPQKLAKVELNIVTKNKCAELVPEIDADDAFCTYTLGKAACWGDYGGPFMVDGRQAGIVAPGNFSCIPDQTISYFVSVAQHYEWIHNQLEMLSRQ